MIEGVVRGRSLSASMLDPGKVGSRQSSLLSPSGPR
jgi:hypothetical protein